DVEYFAKLAMTVREGTDLLLSQLDLSDGLYYCGSRAAQAGDLVPGPREPNESMAHMWNDSYHNDNAFEDADLKLGECQNCEAELDTTRVIACPLCAGRTAMVAQPNCWNCMGAGRFVVCACGEPSFFE